MKKNKDPYPITDVYHVTDTLVDGATVVVTDLCDNLSNHINTYTDDILDDIKKINSKNYNSISVSNGADGAYPVWLGVDKYNKVRKIFAETSGGSFSWGEKHKTLVSWSWNKEDMNDQFFTKSKIDQKSKRQKIFDMKITSGAIAIADHGGNFRYEHHDIIKESLDERYFKKDNIYQNNYPIGLFKFEYSNPSKPKPSSFASSSIHDEKVVHLSDYKKRIFIEFLSNLLDETCYPTKYIFQNYIEETYGYRDILELKVSDKKISANDLINKLPKALQILKKQTKILFKEHFKEVFKIRKKQFEDFIFSIIKDIEPQELDLPTFGKNKIKKNKIENKLTVETSGLPYIQESLYDGYKIKDEPTLEHSVTIPVKNGLYPCYVHTYPDKDDKDEEYQFNYVKIVVEGIEGCYLTRDQQGRLAFNKKSKESSFLKHHINKKSKIISIDQITLRNTETLDELSKLDFVEELQLHGLKNIKNWDGLSKLKNLKRLKLISCDVSTEQSINFFKNLYSLKNLEKFSIDDSCSISKPLKKFPKNLFFKRLKTYEIDFRKEWKKNISENYKNYQGYGDENLYFLHYHLLSINRFPNFNKFKSLEKINFYNLLDQDDPQGTFFKYQKNVYDEIGKVIKSCKKLKDIWIYGFDFKGDIAQYPKKVRECFESLTKNNNVLINGKKISNISQKFKNIKKIQLVNKVEQIHESKIIQYKDNNITLNYFSILEDKDNKSFFENIIKHNPEEIEIHNVYQFIRSEAIFGGTSKYIEDHIKKNKKLKKLILNLNNEFVHDDYGDMAGSFDEWECRELCDFINKILSINSKVTISIEIENLQSDINNTDKYKKYLRLFELFRLYDESKTNKNRFLITSFGIIKKDIKEAINKYFLEASDTIVVIEDNVGWNDSSAVKNIELSERFDFEDPHPFKINLGMKSIFLDDDGVKPYVNESKFLTRMFENESFWKYSDENFNHFLNNNYDRPIILVKQNYLDKANKTLFKNIKHYFYFAERDYNFDENDNIIYKKMWKDNETFKFPKSIKFNKIETLNIFNGRDINLSQLSKQIDCSNLKQLILHECSGKDRTFPNLPNLETLVIKDKYSERSKPYTKFSNLKNLNYMEFKNLYSHHDTNGRWQTTEFDFTDIYKLTNLKVLKLKELNPEFLPPLKTLRSLEELNISIKLITGSMYSDDGIINENLIDEDFDFLKNLQDLRKLELRIPMDESNVKGEKLISYLNKNIENLTLDIHYLDSKIKNGYQLINSITKNLKNLKKLLLRVGREDNFETSSKKKLVYFRKTGEKWKENHLGPRPFIIDFNKISKLNKLTQIGFAQSYRDEMGFKIINSRKITKMKSLKKINIDNNKFEFEDLKYIRKIILDPRDEFLKKCKKQNNSIESEYDLGTEDKKKYDKLNREIKFDNYYSYHKNWGGDTIDEILKERSKKIKKAN